MATVGAETLTVVGEPDGRVVIFGAGKQEVAVAVVFQECEWPFMAFHQNRSHGFLIWLFASLLFSLFVCFFISEKTCGFIMRFMAERERRYLNLCKI